jgi:hypothetical protein
MTRSLRAAVLALGVVLFSIGGFVTSEAVGAGSIGLCDEDTEEGENCIPDLDPCEEVPEECEEEEVPTAPTTSTTTTTTTTTTVAPTTTASVLAATAAAPVAVAGNQAVAVAFTG